MREQGHNGVFHRQPQCPVLDCRRDRASSQYAISSSLRYGSAPTSGIIQQSNFPQVEVARQVKADEFIGSASATSSRKPDLVLYPQTGAAVVDLSNGQARLVEQRPGIDPGLFRAHAGEPRNASRGAGKAAEPLGIRGAHDTGSARALGRRPRSAGWQSESTFWRPITRRRDASCSVLAAARIQAKL